MTATLPPTGIRYPSRAEAITEAEYAHYRVFLDFWNSLTDVLKEAYRVLNNNRDTHILGIHGVQGAGKTLFGHQLRQDWESARTAASAGIDSYDMNSLWHRVTGQNESAAEVLKATQAARVIEVTGSFSWVQDLISSAGDDRNAPIIAIADNAESVYFLHGLIEYEAPGTSIPDAQRVTVAAQALRKLARGPLRNMLLILLTNDKAGLDELHAQVLAQHRSLMTVGEIPLPTAEEKERAVRVNINRLNPVSYWYCLDQAGTAEKKDVRESIQGEETFPGTFSSVDRALAASVRDARKASAGKRQGRPARTNLLTLVALSDHGDDFKYPTLGTSDVDAIEEVSTRWLESAWYWTGWALPSVSTDREASLLESEWCLRVVILGRPFTDTLLTCLRPDSPATQLASVKSVLDTIQTVLGQTSTKATRKAYADNLTRLVDSWPSSTITDAERSDFWSRGQNRSTIYEPILKRIYPQFDTNHPAFPLIRPDLVAQPFSPASILKNSGLRRDAHAIEFTSVPKPGPANLHKYLERKLGGYVRTTQES